MKTKSLERKIFPWPWHSTKMLRCQDHWSPEILWPYMLLTYLFITFTNFQVHRIFNIFDKLLTSTSLLVNKSFQVQHENRREFFQSHSSTDLNLRRKHTRTRRSSYFKQQVPSQSSLKDLLWELIPQDPGHGIFWTPETATDILLRKMHTPLSTQLPRIPRVPEPICEFKLRTFALWH